MYKRILIPTDGSELASKGVDHGLALAKALGIPATVINVTVPLAGFALQGVVQAQAMDSYTHAVKEDLIEIERIVRDKSAKAQVTVDFVHEINSSPATAILETAQTKNCDLIVISSHGRTGIGRMILGSQTQQVLANSTVPVLVVR